MIPYALMGAEIKLHSGEKMSVRLLELSPSGFTFRLSKNNILIPGSVQEIVLTAYLRKIGDYQNLRICNFEVIFSEEEKFWDLYRVIVRDSEFKMLSGAVSGEYLKYIDLKLYEAPAFLSQELCGYPAEQEDIYAEKSGAACLKSHMLPEGPFDIFGQLSVGVNLDHPGRYRSYLQKDADCFFEETFREAGLSGRPVSGWNVTHLYIGNAFCFHLFPDSSILGQILDKAAAEKLTPVLVLPPVRESVQKEIQALLTELPEIELVVNDFGMLSWLAKTGLNRKFTINYGTMMNRRRKDTRLKYKTGLKTELLKENPLNSPEFVHYLKNDLSVRRFSFEACGYEYEIPDVDGDLYLPYFQMNTSCFCTLAASVRNGSRGKQEFSEDCPGYCLEHKFLYPEFLHMTGGYNSLFGFDDRILRDLDYFGKMTGQGIKRIVLEVPG